jgi:hypothetical protein
MSVVTPFTKVFDAIWNLFQADTNFTSMFAAGNRIKFNSETNRDVIKQNVQTSDLPEVMLLASGGPINLNNTSNTTKVVQNYSLVVNTGDLRINTYVNIINWLVLCDLKSWNTILTSLLWRGKHFVKVVRVTQHTIGQSDESRNRGIHGWSTLWNIEVEMHLATSDLVFSGIVDSGWTNAKSTGIITQLGVERDWTFDQDDLDAVDNSGSTILLTSVQKSGYLVGLNYGFDLPGSGVVVGIEAKAKIYDASGNDGNGIIKSAHLFSLNGILDGATLQGDEKATDNEILGGGIFQDYTFGADTDTWNLGAVQMQVSSFNSQYFGFGIKIWGVNADTTYEVDALQLRLHYTT